MNLPTKEPPLELRSAATLTSWCRVPLFLTMPSGVIAGLERVDEIGPKAQGKA
jgi:hypothetical protein